MERSRARLLAGILGLILAAMAAPAFGQEPAKAPEKQSSPEAAAPPKRSPVVVDGRTLFYVQERVYSFSPEDRAKAIAERIDKIYKDPRFTPEAIQIHDEENNTEIVSGELLIMAITERDARAAGRTRQELAQEYAQIIRDTATELQRAYSIQSILLGLLWTLLATGALVGIFKLMGLAFPKVYAKLDSWRGTFIRSIRIQRLELLTADRIADFLITLARVFRVVLVLAVLYFYLPLVFSFFPWTRGWAAVLFEYVMGPLRGVWTAVTDYLPNLFFIAVILVVAYYGIKVVKFFFTEIGKGTIELPGFYADWAEPTYKIVRFLLIAFTAVVVFPYLPGSKSPAFQGVSLFLGLLFSLGSTSAVANIVAGMMLTYTRAFQIGDRVKIGDAIGDVMEKTLLVTRVRTVKNVDISIPNALVLGSHIVNFSSSAKEYGLILHTGVTIGYDVPWRQVHALLIAAAEASENVLKDPKPFVLQKSLDDYYVSYELNAFTDQPERMSATYSELHQNIQDKFNEAGVEILSPVYEAQRDGGESTIPAEYRDGKAASAPPREGATGSK